MLQIRHRCEPKKKTDLYIPQGILCLYANCISTEIYASRKLHESCQGRTALLATIIPTHVMAIAGQFGEPEILAQQSEMVYVQLNATCYVY